jgi:hypothetical protein
MQKIRLLLALFVLTLILSFGTPVVTRASSNIELPPAIVFVQDRNEKMLVKHNFVFDENIFIPGGTNNDQDFYVNIPESGV